jgi:hypothetical protein
MREENMSRQIWIGALTLAVVVTFSNLSLAQYRDDDDGYYQGSRGQARQYGYQQGYQDGLQKGRHEGRENDPNDYQDPNWHQATRGYERWMGPLDVFRNGYRDGYRIGFEEGYESLVRGWGGRDRNEGNAGYYPRGDIYGDNYGGNVAYRTGYQDGVSQARDDEERNKPFNSRPRGK